MSFERLNNAGLQSLLLNPEWQSQTSYTGAPIAPSSGIYLGESPAAAVRVALRGDVSKRTSRVAYSVVDLTTTVYRITIDSNNVDYDASIEIPADATAAIQGIADALEADGAVGLIVTATPDPAAPTTTVLIVGIAEADYSIDASVSMGTGTIDTITADASTCTVRLFGTPSGALKDGDTGDLSAWAKPADGQWDVEYDGFQEAIACGSLERGYLGLYDVAGHPSDGGTVVQTVNAVMIGPGVLDQVT